MSSDAETATGATRQGQKAESDQGGGRRCLLSASPASPLLSAPRLREERQIIALRRHESKSPPFGGLGLVEFGDELAADVQAARRRVSVIARR